MSLRDAAKGLRERAAQHREKFPTGFTIDQRCGVVKGGELALLWARTGAGKTTTLFNIVANTPEIPTLIFNLEMSDEQVLSWLATMTVPDLSVGAKDVDDVLEDPEHPAYDELQAAIDQTVETYPYLSLSQPARPNLGELARIVDENPDRPKRVFIDHLGLLQDANSYEATMQATAALKRWALNKDMALFVVQQTGRGGDDKAKNDGHLPVTLSSGLFAGEHDADWIFGLYRPDRDPALHKELEDIDKDEKRMDKLASVKGLVHLQVVKNRQNGILCETGVVMRYDPDTRRYVERTRFGTVTSSKPEPPPEPGTYSNEYGEPF